MARIKSRAILNMKVSATPTALELIEDLKKTHGKELLIPSIWWMLRWKCAHVLSSKRIFS